MTSLRAIDGQDWFSAWEATYRRWMHIEDVVPAVVVLGAAAATLLLELPVWLFLVGPPGSSKTELLRSLSTLDHVYKVSTMTESALLSGSPRRDHHPDATGGLLAEIGQSPSVIVCKDFGSVLSMGRDQRAAVFAALREVADGEWTRRLGVDGGRTLSWHGKVAIIAGVTASLDTHHAAWAAMGERFIRVTQTTGALDVVAMSAIRGASNEQEMRDELAAAVKAVFLGANWMRLGQPDTDADYGVVVALATASARLRSAVIRNSNGREIEHLPIVEAPTRLGVALDRLDQGMAVIGASALLRQRALARVALDCVPSPRRQVVMVLADADAPTATRAIGAQLGLPDTTVRRLLEDLEILHVAVRERTNTDTWSLEGSLEQVIREMVVRSQNVS